MLLAESAALNEKRSLSKIITSLESRLSSYENQVAVLQSGQCHDTANAVKKAKREERHYFKSIIKKEKASSQTLKKTLELPDSKAVVRVCLCDIHSLFLHTAI